MKLEELLRYIDEALALLKLIVSQPIIKQWLESLLDRMSGEEADKITTMSVGDVPPNVAAQAGFSSIDLSRLVALLPLLLELYKQVQKIRNP